MIGKKVIFPDGRKGKIDCVSHEKDGVVYYSIQLLKTISKGKNKGKEVPSGHYIVSSVKQNEV